MFLPNHRSDIDFLLISYICYHFGMPLPYVCGTEHFIKLALVTKLLRGTGGFFLDRQKLKDPISKACFGEYIARLIKERKIVEHYIEMERSRSGKVNRAQIKVLPFILDAYF